MAIDGSARRMALPAEEQRVKAEAEKLEKKRKQTKASGICSGDVQNLKDRLSSKLILGANQMHAQRKIIQITSGSKELDNILEVHWLSKCMLIKYFFFQLPLDRGGCEGKAIYIDTYGRFRAQRLVDIADRFGLNGAEVLENVSIARACNIDHQSRLLLEAASMIVETRFALMIVDCAMNLYVTDFPEKKELSAAEMHLAKFLRSLQKLADEFGVAVVITNEVVDGYMGRQIMPMFGNIVAPASTTRLALFKGSGQQRICKVVSSPCLAEAEARFEILSEGVIDIDEIFYVL
ncbi:hypothetical protein EJ110_NYTH00422 [Nymphaea thermarum]|nr:hypothetical protein EJ110_NYTH00422 [Nymphaea thermarum]